MASYFTIEEPIHHGDVISKSRILAYGTMLAVVCAATLLYTDSATSTQFSVAVPTFIGLRSPSSIPLFQKQSQGKDGFVLKAVASDVPLSLDTLSSRADRPIAIPEGVTISRSAGILKVEGPKGFLERPIPDEVVLRQENGILLVTYESPIRKARAMFGLYRALIKNMVIGVSNPFEKKMEVVGVGYRAQVEGKNLVLSVGKSHDEVLPIPDGLKVTVEETVRIIVSGINNEAVGQFCADIRKQRPPEPYKGKGIRFVDEKIKLKPGKSGKGKGGKGGKGGKK